MKSPGYDSRGFSLCNPRLTSEYNDIEAAYKSLGFCENDVGQTIFFFSKGCDLIGEKCIKGGVAGITAIISYLSNNITSLIFILALFEFLDYTTGLVSAKKREELSSKSAYWGAVKKIGYFVLVGVAFCMDFVVMETGRLMGLRAFEWPSLFGIFSVCYLISTEGISILENLAELGVKVPFLTNGLKIYREKISGGPPDTAGKNK